MVGGLFLPQVLVVGNNVLGYAMYAVKFTWGRFRCCQDLPAAYYTNQQCIYVQVPVPYE